MYTIKQLTKGLRTPELIVSEANRIITHTLNRCEYNKSGINIFDEDWDNMILLDACRYDFFKEYANISGHTEYRYSRGSTTREFIRGNFSNRKLDDTVYVSANPWYIRLRGEIDSRVHSYINLHTDEKRDAVGGLTTTPSTVTRNAQRAASENPKKRLLVHYLQPHQPFLGEFGKNMFDFHKDTFLSVKRNKVSESDVIHAYRENLELVLKEVEKLVNSLEGKTIISADHGELLGERQRPIPMQYFGHPCGVYVGELLKVPWHIIEGAERKEIVSEEPKKETETDQDAIQEQLSALGYRM